MPSSIAGAKRGHDFEYTSISGFLFFISVSYFFELMVAFVPITPILLFFVV